MADFGPFTPKREQKQRKAASTEKSTGSPEVVFLEEGMTDPMHPKHGEARKAVERADEAFVGSPEEIENVVDKAAALESVDEDLVFFGQAREKAAKAGLIQEAVTYVEGDEDDENGEKADESNKTWDDSPFSPGATL